MFFSRKTAISWVSEDSIQIKGYKIEDLIGQISLAKSIWLIFTGELPTESQAEMFEAILVSVIDHGVNPPSTIACVTAANTGAEVNAATAAGLLAINKYHGGAISDSMLVLKEAVELVEKRSIDAIQAAEEIFVKFKQKGERISGFGHRFHSHDPRVVRLFEIAEKFGINGKFTVQAKAFETVLSKALMKNVPINADGAIAALLCEMNFPVEASNAVFIASRISGLLAHAIEEKALNKPMKTVIPAEYEYVGPELRKIEI